MTRPGAPSDPPATPEPGSHSPEPGLAEDILRAWNLSGAPLVLPEPAPFPELTGGETELAGPERLFAFADHIAPRQRAAPERPEEPESWISFELAGEVHALPVSSVQEIQRISFLTRVPFAPAPVRGITNLRGRVLAVVDLRVRLGLPRAELSPPNRIIVVESRQRSIGLLVDAARQIVKILPSHILPAPADVRTSQSAFLRGVYPREEDLVILLDLEHLLWIPGELAASWSPDEA